MRYGPQRVNVTLPNADQSWTAAILNGDIATDSESDSAEDYVGLTFIASEGAKKIIAKKRKAQSRRLQRQKAKAVATRNFLSCKISKRAKTVVDQFLDIGKTIEAFVSLLPTHAAEQEYWLLMGTSEWSKKSHMNGLGSIFKTSNHSFSYGTVVQLCIARNKR